MIKQNSRSWKGKMRGRCTSCRRAVHDARSWSHKMALLRWQACPRKNSAPRHPPFSFRSALNRGESAPVPGGDDSSLVGGQDRPGGLLRSTMLRERFSNFDCPGVVAENGEGARPWIEGANFALNHFSRLRPIDLSIFAIQFRRVSGARCPVRMRGAFRPKQIRALQARRPARSRRADRGAIRPSR